MARARFTPQLDIMLLKEVVAVLPMSETNKDKRDKLWDQITTNVNATLVTQAVTVRQCKDRQAHLLRKFRADEMASLRASGSDEEYEEREVLLNELRDQVDEIGAEMDARKKAEKKKDSEKETQGKIVRDQAMMALKKRRNENEDFDATASGSDDELEEKPAVKKRRKSNNQRSEILNYLKEKSENEFKLKDKELEMQKLRFEEEKKERAASRDQMQKMMELFAKKMD